MKTEYTFRLTSWVRMCALICAVLIAYPRVIGSYIATKLLSFNTLMFLLFSPLIIIRNTLSTFFSIYPFSPTADYVLQLDDNGMTFGLGEPRAGNSYSVIRDIFKVGRHSVALLHAGVLVYLPNGADGEEAKSFIQNKRREHKNLQPIPLPPVDEAKAQDTEPAKV